MTSRLRSTGLAALSFTLSASVLALALAPAMAHAAIDDTQTIVTGERGVPTRTVSTADLDLTSKADLKRLDARIDRAIGEVCREPGNGRATIASGLCLAEARSSAERQVAALRQSLAADQRRSTAKIAILAAR